MQIVVVKQALFGVWRLFVGSQETELNGVLDYRWYYYYRGGEGK